MQVRKSLALTLWVSLEFEESITPKGPRGVFLQKRSKSAISSSRSPNDFIFHFFVLSSIGSCTRVLGEHVQKVLRHLTAPIVRL
jgi:hypothetical protein